LAASAVTSPPDRRRAAVSYKPPGVGAGFSWVGHFVASSRLEAFVVIKMSMAERYRRWFEYEKDSHAKVLTALELAAAGARKTEAFRKAVELTGHIVAARRLWLFRLGVANDAPSDFFPRGVTLSELARRVGTMHAEWSDYLAGISEEKIANSFEYSSTERVRYRNTVEDILTQLHGHSLYHRGQIAMLLRSAGVEPPATDFVFWTRERIGRARAVQRSAVRRVKKHGMRRRLS
jgi:uncharacterized damage-inducible protein DinB